MAVPRKKVSRMKRGNRRSADALTAPSYTTDKESGELRRVLGGLALRVVEGVNSRPAFIFIA